MEACSAVLLHGHKRDILLQSIGGQLNFGMPDLQEWAHSGDVDLINAGLMQIVGGCAAQVLASTPGYDSDDTNITKSKQLSSLLHQRRSAKHRKLGY